MKVLIILKMNFEALTCQFIPGLKVRVSI